MVENIKLEHAERFRSAPLIPKEKLIKATEIALRHLEKNLPRFYDKFPYGQCENFKYKEVDNFNWDSGMLTGLYWIAYQLTGDKKFRDAAEKHVSIYTEYVENNIGLNDHDTGFIFSPSCIAAYKITGSSKARIAALKAADILLEHYCPENHFFIRTGKRDINNPSGYRTLVDSMMNIPLLFWAYQETGNDKYLEPAVGHYRTTMKYLIRDDASSFHHYQFDPATLAPIGGVTWQGHSDDSCWGRGQSWLLYGFAIAYAYTNNLEVLDVHKAVSYFLLNKLPNDCIPYWDFDFTEGSDEPRDSSVAAISVCGFMEMCRHLTDTAEQKTVFKNAAAYMMEALIDKCANTGEADGLILHVTHALPQGLGIDQCAIYGDYFYMEALMRFLNPDWKMYW
jgi:unsaturated chondroitin disaccharide hydrolase